VLVTQSRALVEAWRAHDWPRLFVELRADWREAKLWCFGHALMEKLLSPYKAITAHTLWCDAPASLPQQELDAWLARELPQLLQRAAWTPLPVAGVPGWWPANEDASFYADARVFRPRRVPAEPI
jgi:hypothetical protein